MCIASRSQDLFVRFVHREADRAALRDGLPVDPGWHVGARALREMKLVGVDTVKSTSF